MSERSTRLLLVVAMTLGVVPATVLAQIGPPTFCSATNVSFVTSPPSQWAGASWNSVLDGYQINGGITYKFDCPNGNFGSCELCLQALITTDPHGDGSYDGPTGNQSSVSTTVECNTFGTQGTWTLNYWPAAGAGLPSSLPYKVKFYAVAEPADGCGDLTLDDYDVLVTVQGTTPPF